MPRSCKVCEKTSALSTVLKKLRGKYNPTCKRRKYPNIQWAIINNARVRACTQCIRTANKASK